MDISFITTPNPVVQLPSISQILYQDSIEVEAPHLASEYMTPRSSLRWITTTSVGSTLQTQYDPALLQEMLVQSTVPTASERRATQNRLAQRAFRQRREEHFSYVKERASLYETAKQRLNDCIALVQRLTGKRKLSSELSLDTLVPLELKQQLVQDVESARHSAAGGIVFTPMDIDYLSQ
jgi:hypothetical protein